MSVFERNDEKRLHEWRGQVQQSCICFKNNSIQEMVLMNSIEIFGK